MSIFGVPSLLSHLQIYNSFLSLPLVLPPGHPMLIGSDASPGRTANGEDQPSPSAPRTGND